MTKMCDPEPETPNNHMPESETANASESSEFGSDVESTSSSPQSNTTSEPSVQCDAGKGNVVFSSTSNEKETDSTNCEYCSVMEKENEDCAKRIAELEERCAKFEQFNHDLSSKLELVGFKWFSFLFGVYLVLLLGFTSEGVDGKREGNYGDSVCCW